MSGHVPLLHIFSLGSAAISQSSRCFCRFQLPSKHVWERFPASMRLFAAVVSRFVGVPPMSSFFSWFFELLVPPQWAHVQFHVSFELSASGGVSEASPCFSLARLRVRPYFLQHRLGPDAGDSPYCAPIFQNVRGGSP